MNFRDSTDRNTHGLLTHGETADERVTGILCGATANGIMISHVTQRSLTTNVFTRVLAAFVHASSTLFAVGIHQTFGSTAGWSSKVSRETGTRSLFAKFATNAVRSTGRGFTGFHAFYRNVTHKVIY